MRGAAGADIGHTWPHGNGTCTTGVVVLPHGQPLASINKPASVGAIGCDRRCRHVLRAVGTVDPGRRNRPHCRHTRSLPSGRRPAALPAGVRSDGSRLSVHAERRGGHCSLLTTLAGRMRRPSTLPLLLSSPGNKRRLSLLHAGDRVCLHAGRSCGTRPAPPATILLAGRHRFLAPVVHAVACTAPSGWRRCLRCNPSTPRATTGPHLPSATCAGMIRRRVWPASSPTLAWPGRGHAMPSSSQGRPRMG